MADHRRPPGHPVVRRSSTMIETIDEFERQLSQLDPHDVAFVLHADALIGNLSPDLHAKVYDVILRFFETHADADCGAPGTLVHHIEAFYPNCVEAIIASVDRKTSYNGVLMIHRILNSKVNDELRERLFARIVKASRDETATAHVREMAARFVQRHS